MGECILKQSCVQKNERFSIMVLYFSTVDQRRFSGKRRGSMGSRDYGREGVGV